MYDIRLVRSGNVYTSSAILTARYQFRFYDDLLSPATKKRTEVFMQND